MSKIVTIRVDESIYDKFKQFAKIENRSLSNFIETATIKYINEIEYLDDFEMRDILNDEKLLDSLQKGSKDARKGRGNFVKI